MITVWPRPATALGQHAAAARVELREHVVEQEQRRRREQLGLGEEEREHRQPLLALRAEAAQLAAGGSDREVVEVRAEPGRPAREVGVEARLERRRPSAASPS